MPETAVQPILMRRSALLERLIDLEMEPGAVFSTDASLPGSPPPAGWEWLPRSARDSPSGLFTVSGTVQDLPSKPRLAIAPPFPVLRQGESSFDDIRALLNHRWTVAIILLRLGHYAVGIAEDERLVASKVGARYVKNRQRQGGQSTNRFARNRDKWIRELFDEAGEVARSRFEEYEGRIDWLALGGDRLVLAQFLKRVRLPEGLAERLLPWQVPVERPGRSALEPAVRDAWASRVYESPV